MKDLLAAKPETKQQFFAWLTCAANQLTPVVDRWNDWKLLPQVGELIRRAKYHAIRLDLDEVAEGMPERAEMSPADGLLQLRKCLKPASDPDAMLTVQQVSAMVQLDIRTIRRQVAVGQFPKPVRMGRAVRWRRCDINRLW